MYTKTTTLLLLLFWSCQWLTAQASDPLAKTDQYLKQHFQELGLTATDIANYAVSSVVVTKHNQLTHVYLQQTHAGIPVHNAILNANILADGNMLSLGNRFVPQLAQAVNTITPLISTEGAVNAVRAYFRIPASAPLKLLATPSSQEAVYEPADLALEPIRVKLVYQPLPDNQVRLAWNVDLYERSAQHWWMARVDALTGEVLDFFDQVTHCEFGNSPVDDCAAAKIAATSHTSTTTVTLTGPGDNGSAYRVFPLTVESPNHGNSALVVNPFDLVASPFSWHDTDGVEGAEYTITRGNNVHAYHDVFDRNESTGGEPDGGDSLCFDFPFDPDLGRPYAQLDAATTNLFYWNNLMHDVWYQYGFDEAAGNFQFNNYENGGADGDYVRAEALDGSGTNNANMSTPADGNRPRMQMYLWGGDLPEATQESLQVTSPDTLAGRYEYLAANFGGEFPTGTFQEAAVVLVNDEVELVNNGCEAIVNAVEIAGKIALVDRGECEFGFKARAAENAGAIAVIICNNEASPALSAMGSGAVGDQVTIPVLMLSLEDCNTIKIALPGLLIRLTGASLEVPLPGPSGRDSDFDNGVIAHEYTHGISGRLTGGPAQPGCLSNFEQAGEGWSDWFALIMTTTSADFAEEGRGIGTYSNGTAPTAGGIRPFPYSRDLSIDPHTYSDINSVSVPHGVGSVWCVTIWDLFWNLVDEYGFDDDIYNGTGGNNIAMQLVLDGLKIQPCNPTFLDARDAILQADQVNNSGANVCLIWETFARRGLGFSASVGGEEAFDKPNTCPPVFRVVKTGVATAEAGDIITYNLEISNGRANAIAEATVVDQLPLGATFVEGSSDCAIREENGQLIISLGDAPSGQAFSCSYQLQVAAAPFSYPVFEDRISNSQKWEFVNPLTADRWQLRINNAFTGLLSLYARDVEVRTDQYLELKDPVFLDGQNPGLLFWHTYRTETNFDGGVIEISPDGGATWVDVGSENFLQNGYAAALAANSDSPLAGRPAFHGSSSGWIRSVADLSAFAGETVHIRFRFATNTGNGREGWFIDDIQLLGNLQTITNIACTDNDGEALCSRVTTVVYAATPNAAVDLAQDLPLRVFPNPTKGKVTVALAEPLAEQVAIRVYSIEGRLLQTTEYNAFQQAELDLSAWSAGVYIIQLRTEGQVTTRRIVLQ